MLKRRILMAYLDYDPLRGRSRVHECVEEGEELVKHLVWYSEERKRAPRNPFWLRTEGIQSDIRLSNELRVSCRLFYLRPC